MSMSVFPFLTKNSDKEIDFQEVKRISNMLDLHPKIVELLFYKDFCTEKSIKEFLHPSDESFHDPFLMKNMRKIVDRIDLALKNGEKIVVFGDYDCDGVCASAIFNLYLTSLGGNVYCHIPNRENEGYGLNVESLEKIIEDEQPDIIITCDCGVSCINEVSYVLDLGIDIIVTDHHEAGECVPECLVLNPKQSDCGYPFNQLCGAGVVLKVVEAHGGRERAAEYMGLAAIATVADLVPLLDENRLIVKKGLEYSHLSKNLGLKMLLDKLSITSGVASSDIGYKVAPRINAAGRMGDAYRSFQLLTITDLDQISAIIEAIENDNIQRKELCNKLYEEAIEIISQEDLVNSRALIITHPKWEKGITGIAAARLASEFYRPTFILVKSRDCYKGTARSVADINIYDLLASAKDLLLEFGGHSQAAGFAIAKESIDDFRKRVDEYLANYDKSCFIAKIRYDLDIAIEEVSLKLLQDMELLEPFGNSNCRPIFRLQASNLKPYHLNNIEHISMSLTDDINVFAFNYAKQAHLLMGEDRKELILDFKLNSFKQRVKIDAYLRACIPGKFNIDDRLVKANFLKYMNFRLLDQPRYRLYDENDLAELIGENIFGTLVIAGSKESYERVMQDKSMDNIVVYEVFHSTVRNNYNRMIASPDFDENLMLSIYDKIVFLDTPISLGVVSYINSKSDAEVFLPRDINFRPMLEGIDMSRDTFIRYYGYIKQNEYKTLDDLNAYIRMAELKMKDFNLMQFIVCLSIFVELDLVRIRKKGFCIKSQRNVKVCLEDSTNYKYLTEKIEQIAASKEIEKQYKK